MRKTPILSPAETPSFHPIPHDPYIGFPGVEGLRANPTAHETTIDFQEVARHRRPPEKIGQGVYASHNAQVVRPRHSSLNRVLYGQESMQPVVESKQVSPVQPPHAVSLGKLASRGRVYHGGRHGRTRHKDVRL